MTRPMLEALWFSRHRPTSDQLCEITQNGYVLRDLELGRSLASRDLHSPEETNKVIADLRALVVDTEAYRIYGVFPTPVLAKLFFQYHDQQSAECYAAWNATRSVEGGVPTFMHLGWQLIGLLNY